MGQVAAQQRRHVVSHRLGQADLATIFQTQGEAACHVVVSHCRSSAIDAGRLGQACGALPDVRCQQGQPATLAAPLDEIDRPPAIDAKGMERIDNDAATAASRRQRKVEHRVPRRVEQIDRAHEPLVAEQRPAHKRGVTKPLFDMALRSARRDRAFRQGPILFLYERAFTDILERLELIRRPFTSALLIGCPDRRWPARLSDIAARVTVLDPGRAFALAAGGRAANEDEERLGSEEFDLCVAIGTLDTVNNLPLALANIRAALTRDALLIGAMSGGQTLPHLRAAMREADSVMRVATPRVHPRIDGAALCDLLTSVGFVMPVVDIDKVAVGYGSLRAMVAELRGMAATNILADRSRRSLTRRELAAAERRFNRSAIGGRTTETLEILHFAAWTPDGD
jgi:NADH dehydrogenase [ubiquinone] 1 alpha subcomplex assembly factor 5